VPEGLTVIVNISDVPTHPALSGATVIVATPEPVAVNDPMSPLPLAANPIEGLSLSQL
jgi:hypothetical protein